MGVLNVFGGALSMIIVINLMMMAQLLAYAIILSLKLDKATAVGTIVIVTVAILAVTFGLLVKSYMRF